MSWAWRVKTMNPVASMISRTARVRASGGPSHSIMALTLAGKRLAVMLVPTFAAGSKANRAAFREKMAKAYYSKNQAWNRKWAGLYILVIFGMILPFCLTAAPQPWWQVIRDIAVILMFCDFFYHLTHRLLFHDSKLLGGPLLAIHAVHHRQNASFNGGNFETISLLCDWMFSTLDHGEDDQRGKAAKVPAALAPEAADQAPPGPALGLVEKRQTQRLLERQQEGDCGDNRSSNEDCHGSASQS